LHPAPVDRLIAELGKLPGIGRRTAQRLAFHILRSSDEDAFALSAAIREVKEQIGLCETCFNLAAGPVCEVCADPRRSRELICVVEEPQDVIPIERTGEYRGLYHVLLGALSPHRGIGPDRLAIPGLLERLEGIAEIVLATNPNVEGEATALYLARLLKPRGIRVTRLAFGMPVGGDIEYTDEVTLSRSLLGRREL
jgi:recombination protein RecR